MKVRADFDPKTVVRRIGLIRTQLNYLSATDGLGGVEEGKSLLKKMYVLCDKMEVQMRWKRIEIKGGEEDGVGNS